MAACRGGPCDLWGPGYSMGAYAFTQDFEHASGAGHGMNFGFPTSGRPPLQERLVLRFRGRPDLEHELAFARLALVALFLAYVFGQVAVRGVDRALEPVLVWVAAEALVALAVLVAIAVNPGVSHARRTLALVADCALAGAAMVSGGAMAAPLYFILLWAAIGNGFCFGARYLGAGVVVSSASLLVVVLTSAYWREHLALAWSQLLALLAIPLYLRWLLDGRSQASVAEAAATTRVDTPAAESAAPEARERPVEASAPQARPVEPARPKLVPVPVDVGSGDPKVVALNDPLVRHRLRVKSMRILVADDQPADQSVVRRVLEKAGHVVVLADSGEAALAAIERGGIDIAIVDLHMPVVSGLDTIRQARVLQTGGRRTVFIVLSSDTSEASMASARGAGAVAYLTKPLDVARLLDAIAVAQSGERGIATKAVADATASEVTDADAAQLFDATVIAELSELGLGSDFVRVFAEQCLRDAGVCLERARDAAAEGLWTEVREECHALKGVASNVGARRLASAASEILSLPTWRVQREWGARSTTLGRELEQAEARLRHVLANLERRRGPEREQTPSPGDSR